MSTDGHQHDDSYSVDPSAMSDEQIALRDRAPGVAVIPNSQQCEAERCIADLLLFAHSRNEQLTSNLVWMMVSLHAEYAYYLICTESL